MSEPLRFIGEPISVEMNIGEPPWEPKNFSLRYNGPMTLRRALFTSDNIIAVRLGLEEVANHVAASGAKLEHGVCPKCEQLGQVFLIDRQAGRGLTSKRPPRFTSNG